MRRKWIRNRHSGCQVAVCLCMLVACLMMTCCVSARALNTPPAGCSLRTKVTKEQYQFPLGTTAWRISEEYGWRKDPLTGKEAFHKGVDLACASGTIVLAGADGIVAAARHSQSYGNYLRLSHAKGEETLYAHMQYLYVRTGEVVKAGAPIGTVGQTGRATGAPASAMTQLGYFISYETTFPYREDFFSGPAYSVRSLSNFALF